MPLACWYSPAKFNNLICVLGRRRSWFLQHSSLLLLTLPTHLPTDVSLNQGHLVEFKTIHDCVHTHFLRLQEQSRKAEGEQDKPWYIALCDQNIYYVRVDSKVSMDVILFPRIT